MSQRKKNKTRTGAGSNVELGREAQSTKLSGILVCDANHTSSVAAELRSNGVGRGSIPGESQETTLLRALRFRGPLGLNTFEGIAAGYCRMSARVQILENAGWRINVELQNVIAPDGLFHRRVARYRLLGRASDAPQLLLSLEGD